MSITREDDTVFSPPDPLPATPSNDVHEKQTTPTNDVYPLQTLPATQPLEESTAMEKDESNSTVHSNVSETTATTAVPSQEDKYLKGKKLLIVMVGIMLSIFLVALDQTIVATAMPKIASTFNALEQVSWVASSYFITQSGLMLPIGQLLRLTTIKWVYLAFVLIFEAGSVICGAAPSMPILIFGRLVAGVGAAGIIVASLTILATILPLEKRAYMLGLTASVLALASVAGPLLGGVFVEHLSWRWCFYINLPFGAITIATILLVIEERHSIAPPSTGVSLWSKLAKIDWVGTVLSIGITTALLLALQWGGAGKPWGDKDVIACFCVSGALFVPFVFWERYLGEQAMMPLRMFGRRTTLGVCIEGFLLRVVLLSGLYYLPLYYQSSREHSPLRSGLDVLSLMVSNIAASITAGYFIRKTGYLRPYLLGAPVLAVLGSGLTYWSLTRHPILAELYIWQIFMGVGVGAVLANTLVAIQAEFRDEPALVPQATSIANYMQMLGGVVGIAASDAIFGGSLTGYMKRYAPDLAGEVTVAVRQNVYAIFELEGADRTNVLYAYSLSLGNVFLLSIPCGILASIAGLLVKDHNLKARKPPTPSPATDA